jgi:hypothetical protein
VKAGNGPISITVDSTEIDAEAADILTSFLTGTGDLVVAIPSGTAFPIVPNAEATFDLDEIDGPPFWIKNPNWAEIETNATSNPDVTYEESGSVVTLTFNQTDSEQSVKFALSYSKSATDAVFTKLDVEATITDETDVAHAYINYLLQSGDSPVNNIESAISLVEDLILNFKDTTAFQFTITDLDGVYYSANVESQLDEASSSYTGDFNGFMPIGPGGPSPAITPDWELWDGVFIAGDTVGKIYSQLFDIDTAGTALVTNYTNLGITSGPQLAFEMSSSLTNGVKYHTMKTHSSADWNSANLNEDELEIDPDTEIPPMSLSTSSDITAAVGHSEDGYLLSMGLNVEQNLKFDITIPDMGGASVNQIEPPVPSKIVGSLSAQLEMRITLSSLSVGVETALINQAQEADLFVEEEVKDKVGPEIQTSPGFELPLTIFALLAIPVIVRKNKK